MKYSILAPAKVNLYLDVLSKREDGYHEIKSVMQAVSIYDEISLEIIPSNGITIELSGSNPALKWDETNLVYKACALFIKEAKIDNFSFNFNVKKNIPVCAGMAGGSTDAAGALILLNKAFNSLFSVEDLCKIGARLGADVAFCVRGGTCLCEGIGDRISTFSAFKGKHMVCAIDESSVSTPRAYAMLDEKFGTNCSDSGDFDTFLSNANDDNLKGVCSSLYNKFETVIIPQNENIQKIKELLLEHGALGALMSGSGPSVFGIFETEEEQKNAFFALQRAKIQAFLCKSL